MSQKPRAAAAGVSARGGRVLIVCAHVRRDRSKRRSRDFLQPISGLHIAAQIPRGYDIRLHHEDWLGPYDTASPERFDLVFVSGLQADFDRMRQLSYHFRRAGAVVIAGGSICTLFPEFAAAFFDAVCSGGVDSVADVIADYERGALKPIYRRPQTNAGAYRVPYHLLAESEINLPIHLIEASRGCSFRCAFCAVPAEGANHTPYGVDLVRQIVDDAIDQSPRFSFRRNVPIVFFVDNNFGDDQPRMWALAEMMNAHPRVKAWGALVTQNVLHDRAAIERLAKLKCRALFVGLESLDQAFLKRQNKKQNLSRRADVVEDVLYAERLGISMAYAYLLDPRYSTVEDMRAQIARIVAFSGMPMPAFISYIEPLAGTAFFWEAVSAGELRPNLRMRDLDGETIAFRKLADMPSKVTAFSRDLTMNPERIISRWSLARSTLSRMRNAGRWNLLYCFLIYLTNFRFFGAAREYQGARDRTYLGGVDPLDAQYSEHPADMTPEDKARYFDPILLTDDEGNLAPWLERYAPKQAIAKTPEAMIA